MLAVKRSEQSIESATTVVCRRLPRRPSQWSQKMTMQSPLPSVTPVATACWGLRLKLTEPI